MGASTPGSPAPKAAPPSSTTALALGVCAHLIWGFFPLYFALLDPAAPVEVIVHRTVWGLVFCLVVLVASGHWGRLRAAMRDRVVLTRLALAGLLIMVNWTVYVHAVMTERTVDAALGYFINPLMTVALGLVVLREKLTVLQKVALGLGGVAVIVLVAGMGRLPWISMVLPLSFAMYSLVKKKVASRVGPVEGMAIETTSIAPLLLGYYMWLVWQGRTSFHVIDEVGAPMSWQFHLALLVGAGVLTMVPLFLFAKAAQGLPLGVLGFIQYVSPVMQMLIGVLVFRETMEPIRWVATAIVWLALACLTSDWIVQSQRARKIARAGKQGTA